MLRFCIGGSETCVCAEGGRGGITYCSTNQVFIVATEQMVSV